jgi:hypothetical protein
MTTSAPGTAVGKKLIDNARVTVWEWRFPKTGDNTGISTGTTMWWCR